MRALKESVKDYEEMLKMKEESIKLLTASLDQKGNVDTATKKLVNSLSSELNFVRSKYSNVVNKFMKLDLAQNFLKTFGFEASMLMAKYRHDYNEKIEKMLDENNKLKKALKNYEDRKKSTIREGKRRILASDPEEAFIILTANNDSLKKEINEQKGQLAELKKQNADLLDENLQIKAELFKLASMVKAQFFGVSKQLKMKEKEIRSIESQPNRSLEGMEESINWGPIAMQEEERHGQAVVEKYPALKINLDGFPGVDNRQQDDLLKRGVSEPLLVGQLNSMPGESISSATIDRLIRNYKRVLFQNRLLVEAFQKNHEMLKVLKSSAAGKKEVVHRRGVMLEAAVGGSKKGLRKGRRISLPGGESEAKKEGGEAETAGLSLVEAKKHIRMVSNQMKLYFEKIVQRIVSPCSFVRIDEKALPSLKVKITRAAGYCF